MYIFRGDFLNFSFFLLASFCIGLISLVLVRSGIINLFDQSKYIQKEYSLNKKYINIKIYISIILFSFIFFETFQIINCLIKKDTFYENLIVAKENNKFGSLENAKSIANAFNLFPNREEVFRFYYFAIGNDIDADRKSKFANKFIENLNDQKYRSCDGFLFCCSCNKKIEYSILDVNAFTEKGDWTNAINLLDQKIAITNNKHFKIQKNILIINDVSNTDESKYNKAVEELKKLPYEIISNYPQAEDYLWQINAIPECNNTKSLEKSDLYFNNFFKRYSADISYATNYHIPPRKLILFHMIGEITKAKVLQGNGALKTFIVETISKCNEMIELLHKRNTEDKDFLKNIFTKLRDKHTFKNTNKDLYLDHMQTRNWINYKY